MREEKPPFNVNSAERQSLESLKCVCVGRGATPTGKANLTFSLTEDLLNKLTLAAAAAAKCSDPSE